MFFVCLANEADVSELLLQIDDFRLGTKRKFGNFVSFLKPKDLGEKFERLSVSD